MTISRRVARPLLASMFISGGMDAFQNPESKVKAAEVVTKPLQEKFPALPQATETLVKINGVVQVGAGALLAIGKFRRLAAWALLASIIPTTYAGHRFWEEADEADRKRQQVHFLKNLGLMGGLILAAFDTEGAPSIGWKTRRRADQVSAAVATGRAMTGAKAHKTSSKAAEVGRRAERKANKAALEANKVARQASHRAHHAVADAAKTGTTFVAPFVRQANEGLHSAAKSGASVAVPYVRHANENAVSAAKTALEGAESYLSAGVDRAGELIEKAAEHLPGSTGAGN
jgi:putative oxidoreductase